MKGIKKILFISTFFVIPLSLVSCTVYYEREDESGITEKQKLFKEKYHLKTATSIFSDTNFNYGFKIPVARDSVTHSKNKVFKYVDYNSTTGITDNITNQQHILSQWWRPDQYDILQHANYSVKDNVYEWKNDARTLKVDKNKGALTLQCDSSQEFSVRKDEPEYVDPVKKELIADSSGSINRWPHFLLESNAPDEVANYYYLSDHNKVYVDLKFTVNESQYTGTRTPEEREKDPLSYKYAGQIFFYVCVFNVPRKSTSKSPKRGIWVGIPLYDTRYNNYKREVSIDAGFEGATNRVIYKCAQSEANPLINDNQGIEVGKTYEIHYDMMPLIKEAYRYAYEIDPNGKYGAASFEGMPWSDIKLNYFNIGYELPGSYNLSATISNFDVYYE